MSAPTESNASSSEANLREKPYIPDPAIGRSYVTSDDHASDDPNRPFISELWNVVESGEAAAAATAASLMAQGATLHPYEYTELYNYADEALLFAIIKGGYRPTEEQLGQTLIEAACVGESEEASLRRIKFWFETIDSLLGKEVAQAMAKTYGTAIKDKAAERCLKEGQGCIDPNEPTPELLSMVEAWVIKHGGS